jgi:hypothetical protein
MIKIKHLKALKAKWVVCWLETWEIEGKEHEIQCKNWLNSEEEAMAFVKDLKEGKSIRGLTEALA